MRAFPVGVAAVCLAVACGGGDSTAPRPDAGAHPAGGTSSAGGRAGGGGASSSGGGAATGGSASATGGSASGGTLVNPDASTDAGGAGGSSGGTGGSGGGTGGRPPLPYCNGKSGDLTTDGLHCGECDNICQPSGIAYGLNAPSSVLADDRYVYWAERTASGRIFRAPLGGANTNNPPVIASGQKNPKSLATDGTNLYWLTDDSVMKRPLASGTATKIAGEPGNRWPGDLVLDRTSIYWTTHGDLEPSHFPAVKKMPLGGGTAIEVATLSVSGDFGSIAVDATNVYFVHIEYVGTIMSQRRDARIYKAPLAGGAAVEIHKISSYTDILELATDSKYLYFTAFERLPGAPTFDISSGMLSRMPLGGGPVEAVGADLQRPVGMAVNEQGVFWAAAGSSIGGGIRSEPFSLAEPIRMAWGSQPTSVAVTATHLYITDFLYNSTTDNGKVTRIGLCVNSECQ